MVWVSSARNVCLILIASLFLIASVTAGPIAIYGNSSGFNPELHKDQYPVAYSVYGTAELFDRNVANFTAPTVEVIFIGRDDTFSISTVTAIEQAIWDGKIMVISYPAASNFSDSLPLSGSTTSQVGDYITVANPDDTLSRALFSGLNQPFNATEPEVKRLRGSLKAGSVPVLNYNNGEPALAYRKYGNGYVIEWTLSSPSSYLGTTNADTVNARLISALLGSSTAIPPTTTTTTVIPVTSPTVTPLPPLSRPAGNVTIQSNPLGATVFFDGVFKGVTPLDLSDITPGFHAVKMTMGGHYDFDGSTYAVSGETVTVFGSLPLQSATPVVEKTVGTTAPVPAGTAPSDPLTNPAVVAAAIGAITAGIGAFATLYSQRMREKKP
jgi:hypothetical protein